MSILLFPIWLILHPNFFKKLIKSCTSGSHAQFLSSVLPFEKHEAINIFSVAPTDIFGNLIRQPFKPLLAETIIYPFFTLTLAPIFFRAFKCKSIGLDPMEHPPGKDTLAVPYFAKSGPKTKTPARIVFKKP